MNKNTTSNSQPNTQGRNKRKSKNARRRARRQQRMNNPSVRQSTSAPASISNNIQQLVRFSQGTSRTSLNFKARVPLYQVCSNYHDGSNLIKGGLYKSSTDTFPNVALSPAGGFYSGGGTDTIKTFISPVFALQNASFVRYKLRRARFVYEPQSATDIEDRLVFAYAEDPLHPMLRTTPANTTQTKMLALEDSVAFAPWTAWEMDISQSVKQDLLYTYNADTTSLLDNRFSKFGIIGCIASNEPSTLTAVKVYGILYGDFEFDFYEYCPTISSFTASLLALQAQDEEEEEEKEITLKKSSKSSSAKKNK